MRPGWELSSAEMVAAVKIAKQLGYVGEDIDELTVGGVVNFAHRFVDATYTSGPAFLTRAIYGFAMPGHPHELVFALYDRDMISAGVLRLATPKRVWRAFSRRAACRDWRLQVLAA